jgi:hypothetical protein
MTAEQLGDQIRAAFPPARFYGSITSCNCDECTDIRDQVRDKRWDEIPTAFLDLTCGPTLLTPEALHAFLPAYLLRALDGLSQRTVVLEFTVYSLCPNDPEENGLEEDASGDKKMNRLLEQARLMSPAQVQAICAFLQFVKEKANDGEWLQRFVTPALETVWQSSPE